MIYSEGKIFTKFGVKLYSIVCRFCRDQNSPGFSYQVYILVLPCFNYNIAAQLDNVAGG